MAAAQQRGVSVLEAARGLIHVLGLEAIDEEGLIKYRKRVPLGCNFEALEFARSLGVQVAINLIAAPDGTMSASASCASGALSSLRSSISASTRLTLEPK